MELYYTWLMNKNILIIDDEPLIIDLIESVFELENIGSKSCLDTISAKSALEITKFDAVFLDLHLAGNFGGDILIDIKNSPQHLNYQTPFYIMSGLIIGQEEEKIKGLYKGLINKPFEIDDILKITQSLLG